MSSVLGGINGTIFCYGQTGAGKTFTMAGDVMSFPHRGLIPRALHQIFQEVELRVDKSFKISVSYLEIYNEAMYDLLSDNPGSSGDLQVIEDGGATRVLGLRQVEVRTEEEALSQFFLGEQMRSTSEHVLNKHSSRSHCIFTVHLEVKTSSSLAEKAIVSKLNLVDLAGNERVKRTNVTGQILLEAQYINKSLTFLEQVVQALARRDAHVPYRQTKLTAVLRDALGGNCRTLMIANVWKDDQFAEESLSTLRFATRVRMLQTEPIVNESSDPEFLVRKYQRQVQELRQELAMRDSLAGRSFVNYADATEAELTELRALLQRYLDGDADLHEIPTDSLKRIRETFGAFRLLYHNLKTMLEGQLAAGGVGEAAGGGVPGARGSMVGGAATMVQFDESALVGEVDGSAGGIHIGQAPAGARPADISMTPGGLSRPLTRSMSLSPTRGQGVSESLGGADFLSGTGAGLPSALDANGAYYRYRNQVPEGVALNIELRRLQEEIKMARASLKDCSAAVNATKSEIDRLTAAVEEKKAASAASKDDVTDGEQYELIAQLKEAKLRYRADFVRIKEVRAHLETLQGSVVEKKQALIDGFNEWLPTDGGSTMGGFANTLGGGEAEDEGLGGAVGGLQMMGAAGDRDGVSQAYVSALRTMKARKAAGGAAVKR